MSTTPPENLSKHLLPCHVRLLDGTDLYIQLLVSFMYPGIFQADASILCTTLGGNSNKDPSPVEINLRPMFLLNLR